MNIGHQEINLFNTGLKVFQDLKFTLCNVIDEYNHSGRVVLSKEWINSLIYL